MSLSLGMPDFFFSPTSTIPHRNDTSSVERLAFVFRTTTDRVSFFRHGSTIYAGVQRRHVPDLWCISVRDPQKSAPLRVDRHQANDERSVIGTGVAWRMRNQSKKDFLSGNGTQTGQENLSPRDSRSHEYFMGHPQGSGSF